MDGVEKVIHVFKVILIVPLDINAIQLYIIIYMEIIIDAKEKIENITFILKIYIMYLN